MPIDPETVTGRRDLGGLLLFEALSVRDGGFHLQLGGQVVPLMMHGSIVPHFLPGWHASHLYTGFAPLFLLELAHDEGHRATWFLDYRMHHVGDAVERLSGEMIDLLRLEAIPVLEGLMRSTLHQCEPVLTEASLAFLSLNEATRLAIAANCLDFLVRPPGFLLAGQLMPQGLLFQGGRAAGEQDHALRAMSRVHLAAGLAGDFQDRLQAAFRDGVLAWPSPVDGVLLHAQGCFCFDDFHLAYRFADARHGLVFFVMVAGHYSRAAGLWFPSLGLLVSHDESGRSLARYMRPHLPYWFVTHSCLHAASLVPYLRRGARRFACVMRGRPGVHIGHQLWNELSGIDYFLETWLPLHGPETLCEWIPLGASEGTELYGPLDELFPALRGHVNRDVGGVRALVHYAYSQDLMIVRVTREHVSSRLRRRILDRVRKTAAHAQAVAALAAARRDAPVARAAPVILLGLRVENRTLVDLGGFLTDLIGFIAGQFPHAVFVLDGHNARGEAEDGRVIESHGESRAARRPVDIEHELAANLREHFRAAPLTITDTIGRSIAASLAWADQCDCFVSIWGASLAKYRWICNRTGLVITSHHNLSQRGDLRIYDGKEYMEAPSELRFIERELVTDRPEAALLVDVSPGDASFFNFEVDQAGLFPRIRAMIEQSLAARA